jgi:MraZ protein
MDTPSTPPSPSSSLFYAGEFRHAIDEKNRITIPSRWRSDTAEEFIILPEANHQFLMVMSPEEFSRMSGAAEANTQVSPRDRRVFFRQLHARAEHGASDRQGRLVLPEDLCKKLNLKGEVALVGGRGRFEIWNLARWKQANTDETSTYQHVAGVLGL